MFITSKKELRINRHKILPGRFNYTHIDYLDKATADQLKVLRDDMEMIAFGEILYMDIEAPKEAADVPSTGGAVEEIGEVGDTDSGGGDVPDEKADESSGRSSVSKRRNRKDTTK